MDQKLAYALEIALRNGGDRLSRNKLELASKECNSVWETMLNSNYLAISGSHYTFTEAGHKLAKERLINYQQIKEESLRNFLQQVKERKGKKISTKDKNALFSPWLGEILEEKLIRETKEDCYLLEKSGEEYLFRLLPVAAQMEEKSKEYNTRLQAIQQKKEELEESIEKFNDLIQKDLEFLGQDHEIFNSTKQHLEEIWTAEKEAFAHAMSELKAASHFHQMAVAFQKNLDTKMQSQFRKIEIQEQESAEKIAIFKDDVNNIEQNLASEIEVYKTEVTKLQEQTRQLFDSLDDKLEKERIRREEIAKAEARLLEYTDEEIENEIRGAYERIMASNQLLTSVNLHKLYLESKSLMNGLSREKYLDIITSLYQEKKVHLHYVTGSSDAEHPEFGIQAPMGLLYYVTWKS